MRISDRIDSQQILGVSLTLIMLLSMGSIGFIGGVGTVGAQDATGGTFDQVIDEDESVGLGDDLNLNNTDGVQAVGTDGSAVGAVDLQSDGYVEVNGPSITADNEFAGIAISPERVGSLTGDSYDSSAAFSFLQDNVDTFSVNTDTANIAGEDDLNAEDDDAYPAILIEYAPQSEFSQIDRVEGGHDFLFLVKEGDGVAAYSVNNSDVSASGSTEVVNSNGNQTFEDTIDELADAGLSDGNIDDIQFVAGAGLDDIHDGTTGASSVTIREVQLTGPNGDFDTAGETIHSEKIALENGGTDATFFSSIDEAEEEAVDATDVSAATITVDRGTYDDDDLTNLGTVGLTITTTDRTDGDLGPVDRVGVVGNNYNLENAADEAKISSSITLVDDSSEVTVEGIVIRSSSDPAIDIEGSGVNDFTLRNVVVDYNGDGTAVRFSPGNGVGAVINSAILASDTRVDAESDTGLNVVGETVKENDDITVTGNLIAGFNTQINGTTNIDTAGQLLEPNLFANPTIDPLAQAAVVADAELADGGTILDPNIYGSIDTADANAPNGSVIDVFSGEYEEDLEETIDTNDISIIGDTNALLNDDDEDQIDFDNSGTAVTLSNFRVASGDTVEVNGNADAPANAITLTNLTLEEGAGIVEVDPDAADAANITIDGIVHEGLTANDPAVEILDGAGDVVVTDVDVTSDIAGASALEIDDRAVESLAVTDVSLEGEPLASGTNGLTININGNTNDIDISNNTVLNGGQGTGLSLTEDAGAFELSDNELRGGESFTGIDIEMKTTDANIDGNVITGESVANGVGIDGTTDPETSTTLGQALEENQNLITGFEILIDSDMSRTSTSNVVDASNESFGTYIDVFDVDNQEYPGVNNAEDAGTLYGNVATAANNVPTDANLTLTVTDTDVDTTGFEPLEGGPISVDSYDYGAGATATLPSESPGITVTGEVSTLADAPVNEELAFEVASGNEALGNHDVTDLLIRNDDNAETVISVDGTDGPLNAQSTFENLNVETIGTGVNVSSQNDDVTVIEIRDSIFNVDGDGIVLADSPDDRDGFVIENVTLAGDNLTEDSDTGLNLSNVDTPGKDELPTELEVRGLDVSNFETQLKLSEELVGLERDGSSGVLDAQAVYEGSVSADGGDIVFADNTFAQAVFVNEAFEEATFDETVDNFNDVAGVERVIFTDTGLTASQERLADKQTIYGSITRADDVGVEDYDFDNVTLRAVDSTGTVVDAPSDITYEVIVEGSDEDEVAETNETTERIVSIGAGEDLELEVNTTTAIVDVRPAGQDLAVPDRLYDEDVVVGAGNTSAADELLVRGPQAGTAATDSLRGPEAIILGTLGDSDDDPTNATTDITIDGLTTVAPHEYSVIEFQTDVDRFDTGPGADRGDFEAGDEFVVDQTVDVGDYLTDVSSPTNLDLAANPLEAPSPRDVATFDDSRDITVNNTAFSASVTEDRVVVSGGDSPGDDIDVERQPFDPAPGEIQTSAVGINASNVSDVTIANTFVGDHTAVDTTGDSVVASGGASVTVVDSTLAPGAVDVSTIEEPTETTNTLLFDSIEGFDVDAATPPTAPVGVNAGADSELTVSASDVTGHPGDGVLVNAVEADVVLNESTAVTDSGARGVGVASGGSLTIDNAVVANSTDIGVDVAADVDLTITEATIEDGSATGVLLDADLAGAEISQTTIADNTAPDATAAGLDLTAAVDAANLTVRANAFENNDFGISAADEPLDATLNYFGDRNGPAAAGGDSVSENVIYDPFLSEDRTDTSPAAIESTTDFAHDVIVPAPEDGGSTFVAVGFPAQLEGVGLSGDATVDDYIDPSYKGKVYAFFQSNNSFAPVSGDTKIEAFDALVVENTDTEDRVVSLEYADDRSPSAIADNRLTYDTGLNFVAPQQAGQVDEVLFPGGDTDAVLQPFPAGENLYGATSADQVRDQFVTLDSAQEVSTNFRSGAGDATVHPHVGYFVVVNENTNEGLTVTESIPVPDSPTADEIANRTDANSDVVATNAVTGDTYESLSAALSEASDFETLVLERGTLASARDELTITQDNLRIVGQGEDQTEIAADLVLAGESIQLDAVDVVTSSPTGEVTVLGAGASLNAVTAERGIDIQAPRTTVTGSSASSITVDANDTTITGGSADSITISDGTTGVSISGTQTSQGITDRSENAAVSDISPADGTVVIAETGASFDSIQAAEDAATTDQTVRVGAGLFTESVTIETDGLTLESADGADATTIVGQGSDTLATESDGTVDGVTVRGFTVEAPSGSAAVDVSTAGENTDLTFSENTFRGDSEAGATVFIGGDSENVEVDNNTFTAAQGTVDKHLFLGGEATYGSADASATSQANEHTVTNNEFDSFSTTAVESEGQHAAIRQNTFTGAAGETQTAIAVPGPASSSANINADNYAITGNSFGAEIDTDVLVGPTVSGEVTSENGAIQNAPNGQAVIDGQLGTFDTVQAAVDAAGADATVFVGPGTFTESVTIDTDDDGLTLAGVGADATTIVGAGAIGGPDATIQVDDSSGPIRDVTIEGFTVENPNGKYGIFAGTGTTNANNDGIGGLVIRDNVVQDVSTQSSGSALTGGPAGIGIRADYGTDGNPGIEISNNEIDNVENLQGGPEPVGITLKSFTGNAGFGFDSTGAAVTDAASPPATDTDIRNNEISNISSNGGFATKGISVSGEFEDVDIIGNQIETIESPGGDARAITLSENGGSYKGNQYDIDGDGNGERIGPQDFDIRNNEISDVDAADARSINFGGYEVFGDHTVSQNTINDGAVTRFAGNQPGYQPGDGDALNLVDNTFTSTDTVVYVSDGSANADLAVVIADNEFAVAVEVDDGTIVSANQQQAQPA